jgi:hypothetical protein
MAELEQGGLWRDAAPPNSGRDNCERFPANCIFPSGRQSLSHALLRAGLSRSARVACPEWSSHCVLSAIGHQATPIPMNEVVRNHIPVDAVLMYEQWGWPMSANGSETVNETFPNALLIWDRVDSADFLSRTQLPTPLIVADVTSLSKLLGLPGGGILRYRGEYSKYEQRLNSLLTQHLLKADEKLRNTLAYKEYFQNHREALHPDVLDWVQQNSLSDALHQECEARQRNLHLLLDTRCAARWEPWMRRAVEEGAPAGIAPLFRGANLSKLHAIASRVRERHQITTAIYHFNWSGNPVSPSYELCLAFPVHGLTRDLESVLIDWQRPL